MKTKNKAYTLIEVIVTIMVVGIIFSLAAISLSEVRRSSRDTKRLSDIAQIQFALEKYYRDEGEYPEELIPGENLIGTSGKIYLLKVPENPQPASSHCEFVEYQYFREPKMNSYSLGFCLEKENGDYNQGANFLDPMSVNTPEPNI